MTSVKFLVVFAISFVAAQAVETRFGFNVPRLNLDLGRIVGGADAQKGEFPHQVSLQWGVPPLVKYQHFCGGSIISSQWILTAGHCVRAVPSIGSFVVKAGKHNIKVTESEEQVIEVSKSIVHNSYEGGVAPYDIALLKLSASLNVNKAVNVINLPKAGAKPTGNSTLSGWGSIAANGREVPEILQKAVLPIIDYATCKSSMESVTGPSPLHETNVCTGSQNGQLSACSGDSGGPLILKNATGAAEVIGIVSWGTLPCGYQGSPSVYVDVAQFVDWIQSTIKNN